MAAFELSPCSSLLTWKGHVGTSLSFLVCTWLDDGCFWQTAVLGTECGTMGYKQLLSFMSCMCMHVRAHGFECNP